MTKPTIDPTQPVPDVDEPLPDPFSPENLRLDQNFTETAGVKKLLTRVPVRKPSPQDFVRVHPDPAFRANFPIIDLKDDREEYMVVKALLPELMSETVFKTLVLAVNTAGTVFLWPLRLPGPDGKDMDWWRSAREAADLATERWIRIKANTNLGAYDVYEASGTLAEPLFPDMGFWPLLKIAFKDHLIDSLDHPVIRRLRGLA